MTEQHRFNDIRGQWPWIVFWCTRGTPATADITDHWVIEETEEQARKLYDELTEASHTYSAGYAQISGGTDWGMY